MEGLLEGRVVGVGGGEEEGFEGFFCGGGGRGAGLGFARFELARDGVDDALEAGARAGEVAVEFQDGGEQVLFLLRVVFLGLDGGFDAGGFVVGAFFGGGDGGGLGVLFARAHEVLGEAAGAGG